MSDQTDSPVANEDTKAPQAEVSQKQSRETQSGNSLAGAALAELALKDPEAKEALRRSLQSEKDKSVAEARKVLDDVQKIAKRLGIDPAKVEQARKDQVLEELYEERYGNSQPSSGGEKAAETHTTASSVDIAKIKQAYNDIDFNDPNVLRIVSKNLNNQDALLAALGKIKIECTSKPKPTSASVTPPTGGVQASAPIEELQAEYQKLLNDPQTFTKPENRKRRQEIIKLMEEQENA